MRSTPSYNEETELSPTSYHVYPDVPATPISALAETLVHVKRDPENGLRASYIEYLKSYRLLEKMLCALVRYEIPNEADREDRDALKKAVVDLADFLNQLNLFAGIYRKNRILELTNLRSIIGQTPATRSAWVIDNLSRLKSLATRTTHVLDAFFMIKPSLRTIHRRLEAADQTLYIIAGLIPVIKIGHAFFSMLQFSLNTESSTLSSIGFWPRFNYQFKQHRTQLLRDFVWATIRFTCVDERMQDNREYLTCGLFVFALMLSIYVGYGAVEFYNAKICYIEEFCGRSSLTAVTKSALESAKKELRDHDVLPGIALWGSYAIGAAACCFSNDIVKLTGAIWIIFTFTAQCIRDVRKENISALKLRFLNREEGDDSSDYFSGQNTPRVLMGQ